MLRETTLFQAKLELVLALLSPGANRSEICRIRGISREHAYELMRRFEAEGLAGLEERSRRPHRLARQTSAEMEQRVLTVAEEDDLYGGRQLAQRLRDRGEARVPAPSTIVTILRRHDKLPPPRPYHRAGGQPPRDRPNELWQMDFKGHFRMGDGSRNHPLMAVDDVTRFCPLARSCANERGETVRAALTEAFRAYGLPEEMLMDNGPPWGNDPVHVYTPLVVWLLRLGIKVIHGRSRHPETQGKVERLNLTLKTEVLTREELQDHAHAQACFDAWRVRYNTIRPHEALGMKTPASQYECSPRRFPERLPEIEYMEGDVVRRVQQGGRVCYGGREYRVGQCFRGYAVAIRLTEVDGEAAVYFAQERIAVLDLRTGRSRRGRE